MPWARSAAAFVFPTLARSEPLNFTVFIVLFFWEERRCPFQLHSSRLFYFSERVLLHDKIAADGLVVMHAVDHFGKQVGHRQYFYFGAALPQRNGIRYDQLRELRIFNILVGLARK